MKEHSIVVAEVDDAASGGVRVNKEATKTFGVLT
jgi:hypothetical protein